MIKHIWLGEYLLGEYNSATLTFKNNPFSMVNAFSNDRIFNSEDEIVEFVRKQLPIPCRDSLVIGESKNGSCFNSVV